MWDPNENVENIVVENINQIICLFIMQIWWNLVATINLGFILIKR